MNRRLVIFLSSLLLTIFMVGCSSLYYATWEQFGKEKRDLLRDSVVTARHEQKEAGRQFRDALTQLQQSYLVTPTQLQGRYEQLKEQHRKLTSRYDALDTRIPKLNNIATDLFQEWREEADTIGNRSFRQQSLDQLAETRARYTAMRSALVRTQDRCRPVLKKLNDYVLFLKHNLNARAIGALQGEADDVIEGLTELIDEMNQSIAETDAFIETL